VRDQPDLPRGRSRDRRRGYRLVAAADPVDRRLRSLRQSRPEPASGAPGWSLGDDAGPDDLRVPQLPGVGRAVRSPRVSAPRDALDPAQVHRARCDGVRADGLSDVHEILRGSPGRWYASGHGPPLARARYPAWAVAYRSA